MKIHKKERKIDFMALRGLAKLKPAIQIDTRIFQYWKLVVINCSEYYAYVNGERDSSKALGIKVQCVIMQDDFPYTGNTGANANEFEKISFKIPGETRLDLFQHRQRVVPYNFSKVVLYGDYQNELSIECQLADYDAYMKSQAQPKKENTHVKA